MRLHRFCNLITWKRIALLVGVFVGLFISAPVYAEYQNSDGIFTDANDVRWEYLRAYDTETEKEAVVIKFFDKPADMTTVIVPSLSEVLNNVPNATQTLDTYFLDDADIEYQAQTFTETKRESTATINKLDMSNTAKIQILGVRPMIDSEVETELVFGPEMVISDVVSGGGISIRVCTEYRDDRGYYACTNFEDVTVPLKDLPFWYLLSEEEKRSFNTSYDQVAEFFEGNYVQANFRSKNIGFGYSSYLPDGMTPDPSVTYFSSFTANHAGLNGSNGVFSGYKLKLTNFSDFNYVGWAAFANATLNEESRTIELHDGFKGDQIFMNSNVKKVVLVSNSTGDYLFSNCSELTEVEFGSFVENISAGMFYGTNLGSVDFSNSNVKTIKMEAFRNANLSNINLEGVNRLEYRAFSHNQLLEEVVMPKSLNWLGAYLFDRDTNLKKITVAYDTLTSGTAAVFHAVLAESESAAVEELVILAPYGEDESVSPTHVTYEDYKHHYNYFNEWQSWVDDRTGGNNYGWSGYSGYTRNNEQQSEIDFADIDNKKNVIAPLYFGMLHNLKSITIGEGYEYIGAQAFWDTHSIPGYASQMTSAQWANYFETGTFTVYGSTAKILEKLSLPSTLKGVGNFAFGSGYGGKDIGVVLPDSLEYIGIAAFRGVVGIEGDFDLPNLIFLGDEAFSATQIRDVTIHDTLQYLGKRPFANCPFIRNVTIDYDLFNPAKNYFYNTSRSSFYGTIVYNDYDNFFVSFGLGWDWVSRGTDSDIEVLISHGLEVDKRLPGSTNVKKYGKIVFTDKVVAEYPMLLYAQYNSTSNGPYFANSSIDAIDLSECGWKTIPPYFFSMTKARELLLPENLETIKTEAFNGAYIGEGLVLPDSIKTIESEAFNQNNNAKEEYGITAITKLPASLETVGDFAFYGNTNLSTDLDCVNLKQIGVGAFSKTGLKSVVLNNGLESLGAYSFNDINTLESITIDIDLSAFLGSTLSYSFASLFNQYPVDTIENRQVWTNSGTHSERGTGKQFIELTVDNIIFTSNSLTSPVVTTQTIWPYCEYGTYTASSGARYCVNSSESSMYPALTSSTVNSSYFYGVTAGKVDLSGTNWSAIQNNMFNSATIGELILPETIDTISQGAFYAAEIGGELKIPDNVTRIESAFTYSKLDKVVLPTSLEENNIYSPFWQAEVEEGVIVPEGTKVIPNNMFNGIHTVSIELPDSLERIGSAAFFMNDFLDIDLDLPNLKEIGSAAFMKTAIRDVVLHDKLETINEGAFQYIPTLRNITLDCDFFGLSGFSSFYGVFSTVGRDKSYQSQSDDSSSFGKITFTNKNVTNLKWSSLLAFNIDELDIANVGWTELGAYAFFRTTINKPLIFPASVTWINTGAFQYSNLTIANELPEGLEKIYHSAFFGADCFNDLVIPSTVTLIHPEAFNAGDRDVFYNSVTIKPRFLNYVATSGQAIFQMFWNAKMSKLIIESETLPIMETLSEDNDGRLVASSGDFRCVIDEHYHSGDCYDENGIETPKKQKPEFHGMNFKEVILNNVLAITSNAFEECSELEKVDLTRNSNLQFIGRNAFLDASKLTKVDFGDGLIDKDIMIGEYAFKNTGIETIGVTNDAGFNLAAANFNTEFTHSDLGSDIITVATDSYAFAEMPALKTVSIPSSFAHKNIPAYTFANDPELSEASLDWQIESMGDGTFNNDNKLKKLFIWGNAVVNETADLTIPEVTTIFAYSDAPAEQYANTESRDAYDGKFYALDEVLYLTTNKTYVILTDDKQDFDKEGLKLYALRRDGVILQSNNWQEYTTAYPRNNVPAEEGIITFEEGRGALGSDEADIAGQVYDAEKPFNTISLANQNYANVNFAFTQMPSSHNPLVLINYPDGYTGNIRTATLASMTKAEEEEYLRRLEEELEVPNTGVFLEVMKVATPAISLSAIVVACALMIARKRRH